MGNLPNNPLMFSFSRCLAYSSTALKFSSLVINCYVLKLNHYFTKVFTYIAYCTYIDDNLCSRHEIIFQVETHIFKFTIQLFRMTDIYRQLRIQMNP